jgi:hypothetical protein
MNKPVKPNCLVSTLRAVCNLYDERGTNIKYIKKHVPLNGHALSLNRGR